MKWIKEKNSISFLIKNWIVLIWKNFILVKIGPMGMEKIFKFRQSIFAISLLSPLEKRHGHSFKQTWVPFPQ